MKRSLPSSGSPRWGATDLSRITSTSFNGEPRPSTHLQVSPVGYRKTESKALCDSDLLNPWRGGGGSWRYAEDVRLARVFRLWS